MHDGPPAIDQAFVDAWLQELLARLRERFGERLVFMAHHGSWARGEAHEASDIDAFILLDRVEEPDLEAYREIIHSMPLAERLASTFMGSVEELKVWPRHEQVECWYGCRALHGNLGDLVDPPGERDLVEDVRIKAAGNLHIARHYLLHPHDMTGRMRNLRYPFKECCYALQSWLMLTTGRRCDRKADLLRALTDADDLAVTAAAMSWRRVADDSPATARDHAALLERWSRKMLARVAEWEAEHRG